MRIRTFLLLLLLVPVTGCTRLHTGVGSALGLHTNLRITFAVDATINPDEKHTPSPLYLRFYELKSDARFNDADFLDLFAHDKSVLGDDVIARRELVAITPGNSRTDSYVVNPETRFVALFAEFYQYENAGYKLIFPVTAHNIVRDAVRVHISGTSVRRDPR